MAITLPIGTGDYVAITIIHSATYRAAAFFHGASETFSGVIR